MFFRGISIFLRLQVQYWSGQRSKSSPFALLAINTGLTSAANPNFAKELPKKRVSMSLKIGKGLRPKKVPNERLYEYLATYVLWVILDEELDGSIHF